MMRTSKKVGLTSGAVALAISLIQPWEGRSLVPYRDIVGVLTWCDGETKGTPKEVYTNAECDLMTRTQVREYADAIEPCLPPVLPDETRASFISAAYNIGIGNFCASSMSRKAKAGDLRGACNALLLWNKAKGKVVRGLTNRRMAERTLCVKGLEP